MRRRGSLLLLVFIVTTVLFIMGLALGDVISQGWTLSKKYGDDLGAYYVAQAGLDKVLWRLRNLFEEPLTRKTGDGPKDPVLVNEPLLDLLDFDRARDWARTFSFGEKDLVPGGSCVVHAELVDLQKNQFYTFIDRVEPNVPEALERFREREEKLTAAEKEEGEQAEDLEGKEALAGWAGKLRLTAEGNFNGTRRTIEVVREIKVADITPPAPDHTLFIEGNGTENIEEGRFILSNLDLPDVIKDMLLALTAKANELLRLSISDQKKDVLRNVDKIQDHMTNKLEEDNLVEALELVHQLSTLVDDEPIKDKVDSIILSLNPRNWGRVRTNGNLYVKLPFFAADDVINYFADNSLFGQQRPEVGYLFHDNRLHDPYLSVYTHFEGLIYKAYRRLNPLSMGPSTEPSPVAPQRYTINTQFNYVDRHPERKKPAFLDRIRKFGQQLAHHRYKAAKVRFEGTNKEPIRLDGIWFCDQKAELGGPYTGRGLVVAMSDITVLSSLQPVAEADTLSLVSLNGAIKLDPRGTQFDLKAGLYAKMGIMGSRGQSMDVVGNLVVDKLNRKNMPRNFTCQFDSDLKNHMVDNIVGVISRTFMSYKERGADSAWTPARITVQEKPWSEPATARP